MIYLTAIGLTPGGSSTVHIYTQTIHRTTQSTQTIHRKTQFTEQHNIFLIFCSQKLGSLLFPWVFCFVTFERKESNISPDGKRNSEIWRAQYDLDIWRVHNILLFKEI
jgi:hypothetical protein